MNEKKYLMKNLGLLTLSQFGSKILLFLFVPLYTYVLTTNDYGVYDLNATTVSILVPLFTINIFDATMRFSLDAEKSKEEIFNISFKYFIRSIILATIFTVFNRYFKIIPVIAEYSVWFWLLFVANVMNTFATNVARGCDKVRELAISGVICSSVLIVLNLLFLLLFKWGITGFFLANIISILVQAVYLVFSTNIFSMFSKGKTNAGLKKEMAEYSKPLMINNISWWINNVSDRYIVTWFCGISENGLYSLSYKIPSILNVIQTIFNQAWTLSAVKDYNSEGKEGFFTEVYKCYNLVMVIGCSVILIFIKVIAKIMFINEFYYAWRYVPFLLVSGVFGALSGFIGGIFAAAKESKAFGRTTAIGALINIVLNFILVYTIGAIGAAISTLISYVIIWLLRLNIVKKFMTLKIKFFRDLLSYVLLVVQGCVFFVGLLELWQVYLVEIFLLAFIICLYVGEISMIKDKMLYYIKLRMGKA